MRSRSTTPAEFGAAVDEVTEENDLGALFAALPDVVLYLFEQLLEQVEAAVDVADRIGPAAPWAHRLRLAGQQAAQSTHSILFPNFRPPAKPGIGPARQDVASPSNAKLLVRTQWNLRSSPTN